MDKSRRYWIVNLQWTSMIMMWKFWKPWRNLNLSQLPSDDVWKIEYIAHVWRCMRDTQKTCFTCFGIISFPFILYVYEHLQGRSQFCQDSGFLFDFINNFLTFERINTLTIRTSLYLLLIPRSSRARHLTSLFIKQKKDRDTNT